MYRIKKSFAFRCTKKYAVHVIFLFFLCWAIRWSDYPAPDIPFLNFIFVHTESVDPIMSGIITGYITGYIVYLLTVFLPDQRKKVPMKRLVMERLATYFSGTTYLLLLICKNCCKSEKEWNGIIRGTDIECFNESFFEYIKRFNISKDADTPFLHKDKSRLTWAEYLDVKYNNMSSLLDDLYKEYHYYLDETDLEIINNLRYSKYIGLFTTKNAEMAIRLYCDNDDIGYYEEATIGMMYSNNSSLSPVFADNDGVDNTQLLRKYIEVLRQLYEYLEKYKKKKGLDVFHENYAIEKLKGKDIGHLGRSMLNIIN